MARPSLLRDEDATAIDLAPMIDCVFILLIFFIVTTRFVEEQGLAVAKPDAAAAAANEESEKVVLQITARNEVLLDGEPIPLGEVAGRVRSSVQDAETPVVIRADARASHGLFVGVWDAARRGGAEALSFTTVD